ncbi:10957_t:CDS:2 [Entrophospora sp. SA101]|nr:10957_t:CDS:2 [Entrophospora sp. SA101]
MESAVKTCDLDKIINFIGDTDAPHNTSHMIMHMVVDPSNFSTIQTCEDESVAGGICGNLFEEFSHKMLKGGGKYEIKLLESEEGNPQRKKLELNTSRFYCYPSIHSFESIDALIPGTKSSNHRLFQMTVSN